MIGANLKFKRGKIGTMSKTMLFSADALARMQDRVELLLEKRGVTVDHEALCQALAQKGCRVQGKQVYFPRDVLRNAVEAVPKAFTLYSQDGSHDLPFPCPDGGFYVRSNTGAPGWRTADGDVHAVRPAEAAEWFELINALPNIDFCALPSVSGDEVPPAAVDLYTFEQALLHSRKHIWVQPYEAKNVHGLIDMAAAAAGGLDALREKPFVSFISCSVPLLSFKHMDAEIIYCCAKAGLPVQPCSLPTAGANTPITAKGTALVCCAEVLAQIAMLELLCPGLPVIATPLPFSMDMMTTYTLQSAPETTLCRVLCMQLFEEIYGIPAHTYATGTDSLTLDGQNYIERTSLAHMIALSGASVLGGAGQIETAKTNCPLTLITDDEIFGLVRRFRQGLEISDEAMDLDELLGDPEETADGFIMTEHTLRHYKEITRPALFSRVGVPVWKEAGCPTLESRVLEKYRAMRAAPDSMDLAPERREAVHAALVRAVADVAEGE